MYLITCSSFLAGFWLANKLARHGEQAHPAVQPQPERVTPADPRPVDERRRLRGPWRSRVTASAAAAFLVRRHPTAVLETTFST
jgi:hypothetical protein